MDAAEHIIHECDLQGWMNPKAKGSADLDKKCSPIKAKQYANLNYLTEVEQKVVFWISYMSMIRVYLGL